MVLRGLLGFLDDLRTRVKPTRGVLGFAFGDSSGQEGDPKGKHGIIAEYAQSSQGDSPSARSDPVRPRPIDRARPSMPRRRFWVPPHGFQCGPLKNIVS
jgi:hypothetical protein